MGADAKPKDYSVEKLKGLWELTYLEDRWITENNHKGIESATILPAATRRWKQGRRDSSSGT